MSIVENEVPIQIGVVASEPMRLEGLVSIFERTASTEHPPLVPVVGALEEHLDNNEIEYLIIDWDSSRRLGILEGIRRKRPSLRMVVIGPENSDDVVMTHSSDLRTMQNIFHVKATGGSSPYLGDAANANDLSDLFAPGVIPARP